MIDREKLIELMFSYQDEYNSIVVDKVGLTDYLIANGVTVQKHGRWVWDKNAMDWGLGGWICSRCQESNDNIPAKPDIHPSGWVGSNYCPNCGAKMEE